MQEHFSDYLEVQYKEKGYTIENLTKANYFRKLQFIQIPLTDLLITCLFQTKKKI
jgi:hypothetical protein